MPFVDRAGNLFNTECEALVNAVNCVGVMGAGIAKSFRTQFPDMYCHYKTQCARGRLQLGQVLVWSHEEYDDMKVISFPTMHYPGEAASLDTIRDTMKPLRDAIVLHDIPSVAIPALGCGIGGLDWQDVRSVIVTGLADLESTHTIELYTPLTPASRPRTRSAPTGR